MSNAPIISCRSLPPSQLLSKERGGSCGWSVQWRHSHQLDVTWAGYDPCVGLLHSSLGGGGIFSTLLHSPLPYHTTTAASVGYYISNIFNIMIYWAEILYFSSSARFFDDCGEHWQQQTNQPGHCLALWIFCLHLKVILVIVLFW